MSSQAPTNTAHEPSGAFPQMISLKHDICILAVLALLSGLMFLIPGPPPPSGSSEGFRATAVVLSTDDSLVARHSLVLFGSQNLRVRILGGPCKGQEFDATNELRAQLELDKFFAAGDRVIVVSPKALPAEGTDILLAQDYARNAWTIALFAAFCVLLCIFGRLTGFNALLSFVFSCILIWKAVIPLVLRGWPASWVIFGCVVFLTAVIMYLVAGLTKTGFCAFLGATGGIFVGLFTAHLFTWGMRINGAVLPYSQTLLFSGHGDIDLRDIFVGAMILASSGAVMDLGMDIASGISEVARHNPALSRMDLWRSGLRMGRNVVGTMTTTLLLAYSGGYITLLMMFSAQGTSIAGILNNPLVAAEIVKTLIGSFSLVLVAPLTAFIGAWVFKSKTPAPTQHP